MNAPKADPEVLSTLGVGRSYGRRRWLWRGALLLLLAGAIAAVAVWRARAAAPKGPQWITATVERGALRETVIATGTLTPLDAVEVGAEVTGRVNKVHVDTNDVVKEGQIIAELDTAQLEARLEEAQAQLRSALASRQSSQSTAQEAEAAAARKRGLHDRGLISTADLEASEATLQRARASQSSASAEISLAQAGVKTAQTNLSKAIIRSPMDGIVLQRTVEVGQTVTSGLQTPVLFTIGRSLTSMELEVDIDEADIGKVKEGQQATFVVDAHPKRRFDSRVVRLSNLPKPESTVITYLAELTVDNSERLLRPGMTATATIVTSEKQDVLTVPNAALRFEPPQTDGAARPTRSPGLPLPGLGGPMGRRTTPRPNASAGPGRALPGSSDSIWILDGAAPRRVNVEVGATDGRRTEVSGAGLEPNLKVVIDVQEKAE